MGSCSARRVLALGVLENLVTMLLPIWLTRTGRFSEALIVTIMPVLLGSGLLAYYFDNAVPARSMARTGSGAVTLTSRQIDVRTHFVRCNIRKN
jgi:hypothetical protein